MALLFSLGDKDELADEQDELRWLFGALLLAAIKLEPPISPCELPFLLLGRHAFASSGALGVPIGQAEGTGQRSDSQGVSLVSCLQSKPFRNPSRTAPSAPARSSVSIQPSVLQAVGNLLVHCA